MRLTQLGAKSVAFYLTLVGAFFASPYSNLFFLLLGFGGLVVSLASILYHVLRAMEHTTRLTAVGLLVLLVGVGFVMGTVYYKTHRDRVQAVLARWQRRIGGWE